MRARIAQGRGDTLQLARRRARGLRGHGNAACMHPVVLSRKRRRTNRKASHNQPAKVLCRERARCIRHQQWKQAASRVVPALAVVAE
jgi:hypothetical protein